MVKRPVSEKGYVIGLKSFSLNLLTLKPNGLRNPNLKTILLAHERANKHDQLVKAKIGCILAERTIEVKKEIFRQKF